MTDYGKFYYWFTYAISYILPFVLLLIMNSVIIHTLRQRVNWTKKSSEVQGQNQGQTEGQGSKIKTSEKHIYATLLMVSFMFIVLTSPACALVACMMFIDFTKSSTRFAGYQLFYHVGQKALYTTMPLTSFFMLLRVTSSETIWSIYFGEEKMYKMLAHLTQPKFQTLQTVDIFTGKFRIM